MIGRVLATIAAVLAVPVGLFLAVYGAAVAATVGDSVASPADRRQGSWLVSIGVFVAIGGPLLLALRRSRAWWLAVAAVVAVVGYGAWVVHQWPPVFEWEF